MTTLRNIAKARQLYRSGNVYGVHTQFQSLTGKKLRFGRGSCHSIGTRSTTPLLICRELRVMFQVVAIESLDELKTYRHSWNELWGRTRQRSFQMTFEWFETYWTNNAHAQEREMKVLVVALGGKVIGILPLVRKRVSTRLGELRVLTYPLDGEGCWYGPIGPNSAATLAAGLRYLSQNLSDWDLLDLPYIDRDRLDLGRTSTAARNLGWSPVERVWNSVSTIRFPEGMEAFLERKKDSARKALQHAEQLARQNNWKWQHHSSMIIA
ncbi:MAG: hypothetical protein KDA78_16425, partial [Planctomycetaceae bacterium]|nr:hypothetical protein [Planctomycetaceae bacterium]